MNAAGDATPLLTLDGFSGPLELLVDLARRQQVDLVTLPLDVLIEQLAVALQSGAGGISIGQKADWLVMASWLVLLRSRLLLPAEAPAQREAEAEADALRHRLVALGQVQSLAAWLEGRPQLGRDMFARGAPELREEEGDAPEVDRIAFLWACVALFDDDPRAAMDAAAQYRPRWTDLFPADEARQRLLDLLQDRAAAWPEEGWPLDRLVPQAVAGSLAAAAPPQLRRRAAWASTFTAALELARQGALAIEQTASFGGIRLRRPAEP